MELNRNQFMLIGLLLVLLGLQLRFVDSYVLSEESTRFLAKRTNTADATKPWTLPVAMAAQGTVPIQRKRIRPPGWIAFALLSVGGVLMLHAVSMRKPGG